MPEPQLQNAIRLPAWGSDLRDNVNRMRDAADKSQLEQQQREHRERIHGDHLRGLLEAFGYEEGPEQERWRTIPREETRPGGPAFEWRGDSSRNIWTMPETKDHEDVIRKSRDTLRKPSFENLMREMDSPPGNR